MDFILGFKQGGSIIIVWEGHNFNMIWLQKEKLLKPPTQDKVNNTKNKERGSYSKQLRESP